MEKKKPMRNTEILRKLSTARDIFTKNRILNGDNLLNDDDYFKVLTLLDDVINNI